MSETTTRAPRSVLLEDAELLALLQSVDNADGNDSWDSPEAVCKAISKLYGEAQARGLDVAGLAGVAQQAAPDGYEQRVEEFQRMRNLKP